jgi:outer membrane protein assembly factor BamB
VDSQGDLFIADNEIVRKISAKNGLITTVAGSGKGDTVEGSSALSTRFKPIEGLAVDSAGDLFISDGDQGKIFEMNARTGQMEFRENLMSRNVTNRTLSGAGLS